MPLTKRPKQKPKDQPKGQRATEPVSKIDWLGFASPVAGTDEVGRGCLAGPVYAAAVILCPNQRISGLTDSKLLQPKDRMDLASEIESKALSWAVASCSVEEIEVLNILRASLLAMSRAVERLTLTASMVLVDGNFEIPGPWAQRAIIKGDLLCEPISAASILAKVARDAHMDVLEKAFPGYGFSQNKGYGTREHLQGLRKLGPCVQHRKTFGTVSQLSLLDVLDWQVGGEESGDRAPEEGL